MLRLVCCPSRPFVLSILVLAANGCGETPAAPDVPGPAPDPTDGMLVGDPAGPALDGVRSAGPVPVAAAQMRDGFVTTRLAAVLAPSATVGEVNDALEAHGARVVTMRPGSYAVTLSVAEMATLDAAWTLAETLIGSPAFAWAAPAAGSSLDAVAMRELPPSGITSLDHWMLVRMPAAWNVAGQAMGDADPVTALVPDQYFELSPHVDISAQRFVAGAGGEATVDGNHGFAMAGIIGADFDEHPLTGASPAPEDLLDIVSVSVAGLATMFDLMVEIRDHLPASGSVVLNTSFGSKRLETGGSDLSPQELTNRAFDALFWRSLLGDRYGRYLHVAAAGNNGTAGGKLADARFEAPWSVSASWDDPREIIPVDALTEGEWASVDAVFDAYFAAVPHTTARTPNLIVVGASDAVGARVPSSNEVADVRTIGEGIWSACVSNEGSCTDGVAVVDGTSPAAAIVSGIAAYVWSLAPSLSVQDLRSRILDGYSNAALIPGLLDAFNLVLGLDSGVDVVNGRIRLALVDVVGPSESSPPNGVLDEHDLAALLQSFALHDALHEGIAPEDWGPDFSRADLNGSGITHESGAGQVYGSVFDLDANGSISSAVSQTIEGRSVSFDESSVTDEDVLCYYAYSDLYAGDETARRELLTEPCVGSLMIQFVGYGGEVAVETVPKEATFRVWLGSDPVEGATLEVSSTEASVSPETVTTDAEGYARVTVTPPILDSGERLDEFYMDLSASTPDGKTGEATQRSVFEALMRVSLWESSRHITAAAQAQTLDSTVTAFDSATVSVPHQGTIQHLIDLSPTAEVTRACEVGSQTVTASTELTGHITIEKTLTTLRYEVDVTGLGQGSTTRSPDANSCEGSAFALVSGALGQRLDIFPNRPATYTIEIEYATDAWEDNSSAWAAGLSGGFSVGDLLNGDQLSGSGQVDQREPLTFFLGQIWRSARARNVNPQGAHLKVVFTVTLLE